MLTRSPRHMALANVAYLSSLSNLIIGVSLPITPAPEFFAGPINELPRATSKFIGRDRRTPNAIVITRKVIWQQQIGALGRSKIYRLDTPRSPKLEVMVTIRIQDFTMCHIG